MLETIIREKRQSRDILLMTHIVIGYPDLDTSYEVVKTMVEAGVDLMELQIPFSEPIADGPVILGANQAALDAGVTVEKSLAFAARVAADFPIPFLFMTYYNIPFRMGADRFAAACAQRGVRGAIVPDLPPEEAGEFLAAMDRERVDSIFIFAPTSSPERMRLIADHARGFVYCVARKGVTGRDTAFSSDLEAYLARCRAATDLPLAVGFGVKDRADVDFLRGKADIAVIGTQSIRIMARQGVGAVGDFLRGLRA